MLPFHQAFSRWRVVAPEQVGTIPSPLPPPWLVARGSKGPSPLHTTVLPQQGPVQWDTLCTRSVVAATEQPKAVAMLAAASLWELWQASSLWSASHTSQQQSSFLPPDVWMFLPPVEHPLQLGRLLHLGRPTAFLLHIGPLLPQHSPPLP